MIRTAICTNERTAPATPWSITAPRVGGRRPGRRLASTTAYFWVTFLAGAFLARGLLGRGAFLAGAFLAAAFLAAAFLAQRSRPCPAARRRPAWRRAHRRRGSATRRCPAPPGSARRPGRCTPRPARRPLRSPAGCAAAPGRPRRARPACCRCSARPRRTPRRPCAARRRSAARAARHCLGRSSWSLVSRARRLLDPGGASVRASSARSRRVPTISLTVARARSAAPTAASNGAFSSSTVGFSAMVSSFRHVGECVRCSHDVSGFFRTFSRISVLGRQSDAISFWTASFCCRNDA